MDIQMWREMLLPYELAVDELTLKFQHIIDENRSMGRYSSIESVEGRVKAISSILDKAKRKDIPLDRLEEEMFDIAGIRLICQFSEDIPRVVSMVRSRDDIEIVEERDYMTDGKESGYRSYHLIVKYEVITIFGKKKVFAEIQIRTMAMNFWATIEHSLKYKYSGELPESVSRRLQAAGRAVYELDHEMDKIRDEIVTAQDLFFGKARIVSEIRNNIRNLYRFEARDAVINIQNEFFDLYQNGTIEELEEFNKKLDDLAASQGVQSIDLGRDI